jgi:hypothetical protein
MEIILEWIFNFEKELGISSDGNAPYLLIEKYNILQLLVLFFKE